MKNCVSLMCDECVSAQLTGWILTDIRVFVSCRSKYEFTSVDHFIRTDLPKSSAIVSGKV